MVSMVGRGQVSVAGAADLARCAVDDGMVHDAVKTFSSLGSSGTCPSNCERDMTRWLQKLFNFTLEPYTFTLHLQVSRIVLYGTVWSYFSKNHLFNGLFPEHVSWGLDMGVSS